jgi:hypothetical protein
LSPSTKLQLRNVDSVLIAPRYIASIHFNETSFGTKDQQHTGSAAEGDVMFMPETWAAYA